MTDFKHIIEPERMGLWVAVSFIIALLALVVALVGIKRNSELAIITQSEILLINKKVEGAKPAAATPAPAPAPEAEAK